jgi:fructokinase
MNRKNKVVCFGEVLWDVLSDVRKPGGAPMNVAYHLNRLGIESIMISRIGYDKIGEQLKDFLREKGIETDFIQTDFEYPTSEVIASINENDEVTYEILYPVAWDFIEYKNQFNDLLTDADMLVYGSLAARNETSRQTLNQLIDHAKYRLFDVNLRAPHFSEETVINLLKSADAVKLNSNELQVISSWFGGNNSKSETNQIARIQREFAIPEIILTKGGQGASYYTENERYDYQAYSVDVQDTIGSGDSFLAAFISQKLSDKSVEEMLDYAVALGAFVSSQSGANPTYRIAELHHFVWNKKLNG